MKTRLLIFIGITMIGTIILPVNAQYMGDKVPKENELGEYIGGPEMNPEQQLVQRLENDQKNVFFVLVIGIPFLVLIGFIVWRKRK
jgi:cytochrome b subunit of formate dehydrogenase